MSDENKPTPQSPAPEAPVEQVAAEKPVENKPVETPVENTSGSTGPKNIAWDVVFSDFCRADENGRYPTLRELCEKYDVTLGVIGERASRENWIEKRNNTITEAEQKAAQAKADRIIDADNRHLKKYRELQDTANRLLKNFQRRLDKYDDAQRELETETDPEKIKKLNDVRQPGIGQLSEITGVMKTAIDGERVVLGLATTVTKDLSPKGQIVTLPPELIAEVDDLFRKNGHPGPANSNANN